MRVSMQSALAWLFVSLTLPAIATAADETRANGQWTVAGKTVELAHVRAFREPDPFGRGASPCVLLSNEPVPDAAVPADDDGVSELLGRMRGGTLRALEICFDDAGSRLRDVNDAYTFHPDVSAGRFAFQGYHTFVPDPGVKGRIAGKLTGAGDTNDGGKWTDEVAFSVPMPGAK